MKEAWCKMLLLCMPNLEHAVRLGNITNDYHVQHHFFQDVIMKFIYLGELYLHYSLEAKLKNIVIV